MFNRVFPFSRDKNLKKLIREINRQSSKQMVHDIIAEFEKQDLHGLLPMFAMPWWYDVKVFEGDEERINRVMVGELVNDNQKKVKELEMTQLYSLHKKICAV